MQQNQCPICESDKINYVLTASDHLVSGEKFKIYGCARCNSRFTNPRPAEDDLPGYYDSEEYISHSNEGSSLVSSLYKIARNFTLRRKQKIISRLSKNKRLLDVGCGTGHFIDYCQQYGWQVSGVEPNEMARKQAEHKTSIKISSELNEVVDGNFDVITLWHVLEHLPHLKQTMNKLKSLLSTNGVLVIAVPNFEAYEASIFKENWAAYDVPRHLYHFSRNSMTTLASKYGLKVVRTYPMRLDSFYISLLSNKSKSGSNKYLNSFITGLLSNLYAIKSKNYSSLIYQLIKSEK